MTEFEKKIGYTFNNKEYLKVALTHSSYANEHGTVHNERLEFLGDSVLGLIVSQELFSTLERAEGDLSKIRAALVCEASLYELSKKIDLPRYILLGHGAEATGGRSRPSLVSDAFEALIAAIFLDSDFATVRNWLLPIMGEEIKKTGVKNNFGDYKTMLQERTQKGTKGKVTYSLVDESGPDHNKVFVCSAEVDGVTVAKGSGRTKKEAEQNAARAALEML